MKFVFEIELSVVPTLADEGEWLDSSSWHGDGFSFQLDFWVGTEAFRHDDSQNSAFEDKSMLIQSFRYFPAGLAIVALFSNSSEAQFAVQQPIVEQLQIGTTVTVPDRGGAFIGGVKRARDSRSSFGLGRAPFKPGSSIGFDREFTGVSVHAYIHDFDSMDRMLLEEAERGSRLSGTGSGSALERFTVSDLAAGSMRKRFARPASNAPFGEPSRRFASLPPKRSDYPTAPNTAGEGERSYQLGLAAMQAGRAGVAKLHFKKAAKYGSSQAAARLSELVAGQ